MLAAVEGVARPEWTNSDGHMTAAAFPTAFAAANDAAVEALGFGAAYREESGCALVVVEARYRYRAEMRTGDPYAVTTWLAAADDKRLTLGHRMTGPRGLAAEAEILFLHVARDGPRAAPLPDPLRARLAAAAPCRSTAA